MAENTMKKTLLYALAAIALAHAAPAAATTCGPI